LFTASASPLQTPGVPLTQSPLFSHSIVILISIFAALAGIVYGYSVRSFKRHEDVVVAAEESIGTMSGYIVLMFFAAQFVNYFNWSKLGIISSMAGAEWLQQIHLPTYLMIVLFVILVSGAGIRTHADAGRHFAGINAGGLSHRRQQHQYRHTTDAVLRHRRRLRATPRRQCRHRHADGADAAICDCVHSELDGLAAAVDVAWVAFRVLNRLPSTSCDELLTCR